MSEVTMTKDMSCTTRMFLLRLALVAVIVVAVTVALRAGGPKCVAGTNYFDPTMTGQALVWPAGSITFYTDQGDLSPAFPNASANNLIASAFSVWTSVPTAAVAANSGGLLAEDVNGTNVTVNGDGTISMPADIQSTATGTPVGIVYDYDGAVTSALVGAGAGDASQCFFNAVTGGNDNYESPATYGHGLIVINGQCAQQASQQTDVEYRLVRAIGGVLGLGWSQVNVNVQTGAPYPTSDDYAGFPVMHFTDLRNCVPITLCYANPYQLSMDDVAEVSRLYPVTAQNQAQFPGKQITASASARIHGSVYFTDAHGNRTQPMQGVNVVARWIDPKTGLPSHRYAASSVSGFRFSGNQGNVVTGYNDPLGDPYNEWGSGDPALEGFFDLGGLQPPSNGAQYQLTVEAIDPTWSSGVGPYAPGPVSPSGVATPITVTVSPGSDLQQDILMTGAAQPLPQISTSWTSPATLPAGGDWVSSLDSYGETDYFQFPAQANRTLSIAVTALDESGNASALKVQPVIGMWAASDPEGTPPPAFTPGPFNQQSLDMTRLDASVLTSANFLIGISDVRGDGRPDYRYHARVLYADSVSPARVGIGGGAVTVSGTGFAPGLVATIGATSATQLAISAGQITLAAPAHSDGLQNISLTDPVSGAATSMSGVLLYGAADSDNLVLLNGSNPTTLVGVQAANPVSVRVLAADGVTPVSGATVGWSANNGAQLSACSGATACSITTDQNGNAATWVTPAAPGSSTITATLAPSVYSSSKSVSATVNATESASDIGATTPYLYVSQGATVSLALTARALSNGVPRNSLQVNFALMSGSGTLSSASSSTNASGYATVTLTVSQISTIVQVSACVAPGNSPCTTFYVNPVALTQQRLQQVSGAGQVSNGAAFQAVAVRVTDSAAAPDAVIGAPVTFLTTVLRPGGTVGGGGETNPGNPAMPVILKVTQTNVTSDGNGLASIVPSSAGFSAPVEVDVSVTAGSAAYLDVPSELLPPVPMGTVSPQPGSGTVNRPPARSPWSGSGER